MNEYVIKNLNNGKTRSAYARTAYTALQRAFHAIHDDQIVGLIFQIVEIHKVKLKEPVDDLRQWKKKEWVRV